MELNDAMTLSEIEMLQIKNETLLFKEEENNISRMQAVSESLDFRRHLMRAWINLANLAIATRGE